MFDEYVRSLQSAFRSDDPRFETRDHEQRHVESLRRQVEAIGGGDLERFLGELDPDVSLEIHAPACFPWIRRARGIEQVRAAVLRNFGSVAQSRHDVLALVAQGDVVDVTLREAGTVRATGEPYDVIGFQQFTFREGRVTRLLEVLAPTCPD